MNSTPSTDSSARLCCKPFLSCSWEEDGIHWCSFDVQPASSSWEYATEQARCDEDPDYLVNLALEDVEIYIIRKEHELPGVLCRLGESMEVRPNLIACMIDCI